VAWSVQQAYERMNAAQPSPCSPSSSGCEAVEQQDEADGRRRTRAGTGAHSRAAARGFLMRRPQLILVLAGP
jgi:hypothetical protein